MALKPDAKLVAKLSRLLRENDLSELEYQVGDERVKVAIARADGVRVVAAEAPRAERESPPPAAKVDDEVVVGSPMVGMAYLAPQPGAATYVKTGDMVRKGKTLLIIEAMKTMNPVAAPVAGVVEKVIVKNETPVEYGQPLLILKPS